MQAEDGPQSRLAEGIDPAQQADENNIQFLYHTPATAPFAAPFDAPEKLPNAGKIHAPTPVPSSAETLFWQLLKGDVGIEIGSEKLSCFCLSLSLSRYRSYDVLASRI